MRSRQTGRPPSRGARRVLYSTRWLARALVAAAPAGTVAGCTFVARGGHYVGRDNYNLLNATSACVAHPTAEMEAEQRWNPVANAAMADAGVPVLRVWAATQQAHAFHIGFGDCTHWCQLRGGVPELLLPPLVEELLRLPPQPTTDPGVDNPRTPRNRVLDSAGHLGEKIGYCDATVLGEGSLCAPSHHKGSWTVKTMAECVQLCLDCPQCRFVTRYAPLNECLWFSRCPGFPDRLQRRKGKVQSKRHRTRLVHFHNGSVARSPATPLPQWAGARFAAMSCGSSDMLTEDQWLQFYRANSGWAAMTVVTTAHDDPCPFCAWTHLTLPRRGQPWGHWELRAQAKAWRSHLVTVLADYYVYLRPDMAWLVPVQRLLVQLRPDGRSLIYVPNHPYGAVPTPEWSNGTEQVNDRVAIVTRTAAASFFNRAHRLDADLSRFFPVVIERLLGREMVERRVAVHTFPVLAVVRCCMNPASCADRRALSGRATKCRTLKAAASDGPPLEVKYQYEAFAAATYAEALLRGGAQLDTCDRGFCLRPRVTLSWDRIAEQIFL